MEVVLQLTSICIVSVCFSLLLKKNQPEVAFLLGTCTVLFLLFRIGEIYRQMMQYIEQWKSLIILSDEYFKPLLKCLGVSLVSHFGVNLCKDAGYSAIAGGLELSGNMACVWCIIPLIGHLFSLIEGLT